MPSRSENLETTLADVEFKLVGLEPILAKMKALPPAIKAKGARVAGRKAANLVRNAAIQNASRVNDPMTKEEIAKNIVVRFSSKTFARTGDVAFRVGVLGGARQYAATRENRRKGRLGQSYNTAGSSANPGGDTFYWRFVEFGTERVRAQPILRPALEQNADKATTVFTEELNRWLDRQIKKAAV